MNDQQLRTAGALSGLAAVVCAALPWATLGAYSKSGIDGSDGVATALMGGFGGFIAWRATRRSMTAVIVLGALVALLAGMNWIDISGTPISIGIGLYGTVLAGLALLAVGIARRRAEPQSAGLPPPTERPVDHG